MSVRQTKVLSSINFCQTFHKMSTNSKDKSKLTGLKFRKYTVLSAIRNVFSRFSNGSPVPWSQVVTILHFFFLLTIV